MSASDSPALDAIVLQLAAALEDYDSQVARLVDTWLDMDLYTSVSDKLEEIRRYSGAIRELGVPWVQLLIAHAELVHSLWRLRFREEPADSVRLDEVRQQHAACVASLRNRCLRLIACSASPVRG